MLIPSDYEITGIINVDFEVIFQHLIRLYAVFRYCRKYTWSSTYDLYDLRPQKIIINKLIINQDVLLRTPINQVRGEIKDD
jgi:hypothetical protein